MDITKNIEDLVAYDSIKSAYSSFSQKAGRKVKDFAKGIYNDLAKGEKIPEDSRIVAMISTETEMKARGTEEGIKAFTKKYPKYGNLLESYIDKERESTEIYLKFGLKEGCELPSAAYLRVFRDLGISSVDAYKVFSVTNEVISKLKKKKEDGLKSLLINLDKKKKQK